MNTVALSLTTIEEYEQKGHDRVVTAVHSVWLCTRAGNTPSHTDSGFVVAHYHGTFLPLSLNILTGPTFISAVPFGNFQWVPEELGVGSSSKESPHDLPLPKQSARGSLHHRGARQLQYTSEAAHNEAHGHKT